MHENMEKKKEGMRKSRILLVFVAVVVAALVIACVVYLNGYYRADIDAIVTFSASYTVSGRAVADGVTAYVPEDPVAGLIFYPGGLVEHRAYEPLMLACAEEGILCVLLEMPFHLAVLDMNAADGIQARFPQVEKWYIGGHSLGGAIASSYAAKHVDEFSGVVLLGAYATADIRSLDVLSLYGSEDKVMNKEKYVQNLSNLPDDFSEIVIEGGCHAGFGMYGAQDGDGMPSLSAREQIVFTADAISAWIRE